MKLFRPGQESSPWIDEKILSLIEEHDEVRALNILAGPNLGQMHKYVEGMHTAVNLKVAEEGDATPNLRKALASRTSQMEAITFTKKREQSRCSMGVDKSSDLATFSLRSFEDSTLDHFERICKLRRYPTLDHTISRNATTTRHHDH